jgi:hypothetical protein
MSHASAPGPIGPQGESQDRGGGFDAGTSVAPLPRSTTVQSTAPESPLTICFPNPAPVTNSKP